MIGNAKHSLTQKCIWLVILLTTVVSVMPVLAFRFLKVDLFPTLSDQVCCTARVPSCVCPFPLPVKAHSYVNQENNG